MRPKSKMLHRLTRILRSPQQQTIAPQRRTHSELVQLETLTASFLNASARGGREAKCEDGQLGDYKQTGVVGDGADDDQIAGCGGHLFGGPAGGEHG